MSATGDGGVARDDLRMDHLPKQVRSDAVARAILRRNGSSDIPSYLARMRISEWTAGTFSLACHLCSFDVATSDGQATLANATLAIPGGIDLMSAGHMMGSWRTPRIKLFRSSLPETVATSAPGLRLGSIVAHPGLADLTDAVIAGIGTVDTGGGRTAVIIDIEPDWVVHPVGAA